MKRIVIAGAAGFGREIAWVLRRMDPEVRLDGFCDDDPARAAEAELCAPYLGTVAEALSRCGDAGFFCAIGSNPIRRKIFAMFDAAGVACVTVVDPTAVIAPGTVLGAGTFVGAGAVVSTGCALGRGCIVNHAVTVGHDVTAGDFVQLCPGVRVSGGCRIGAGALLGSNSCTIPGRTMGAWSTLGAGCVLLRDLDEGGNQVRIR
jgi:sugar O-acyltransferase (sialic acid O-acetyltransferase NeuD family)